MRLSRLLLGLSLLAALTGCRKDDGTGSTAGTTLYVYDNTSHHVLVWKDMEALYDAAAVPTPDATLSANQMDNATGSLTWGGLVVDPAHNQLYLVYTSGTVVRVNNLRLQTGAITNPGDIASFTLDSSHRISGGSFGQAALDPNSGNLYVTESSDSATNIWVVTGAGSIADTATAPFTPLPGTTLNDKGGTGVAAGPGRVFAYMEGGNTVTDPSNNKYDGHRLRRSVDAASFNGVIIDNTNGATTQLGAYGSLALDRANNTLYVGVNTAKSTTAKSVLAFHTGDFNTGYNVAPAFTLDAPVVSDLRVLAHAGTKDWLVGLRGSQPTTDPTGDLAYGELIVWKAPASSAGTTKTLDLGALTIRGAALDGSGG